MPRHGCRKTDRHNRPANRVAAGRTVVPIRLRHPCRGIVVDDLFVDGDGGLERGHGSPRLGRIRASPISGAASHSDRDHTDLDRRMGRARKCDDPCLFLCWPGGKRRLDRFNSVWCRDLGSWRHRRHSSGLPAVIDGVRFKSIEADTLAHNPSA